MIARVFDFAESQDEALRRLGMAVVLQWSTIPPVVKEGIVLQALATANSDARLDKAIAELLRLDRT